MENQVPEEIKHERFNRLKALVESQIEINNQKYLNSYLKSFMIITSTKLIVQSLRRVLLKNQKRNPFVQGKSLTAR